MTGLEFLMAARAFPGERFAFPTATLEIESLEGSIIITQ